MVSTVIRWVFVRPGAESTATLRTRSLAGGCREAVKVCCGGSCGLLLSMIIVRFLGEASRFMAIRLGVAAIGLIARRALGR